MSEFVYNAPPTVSAMMRSDHRHRAIKGPIGSGKSVGCCVEILRRCTEMPAWNNGKRSSRWAIIRNTSKELRNTTLETWLKWMSDLGRWYESKSYFHLNFGDVDAKIMFLPLDTPGDVGRLLSLELTGAWMNECREIPFSLTRDLKGRLARYPSFKDAPDRADFCYPTDKPGEMTWFWNGLICDTNPPEEDSEWFKAFEMLPQEDDDPDSVADMEPYHQPSGMSDEAENTENLIPGYYDSLAKGATKTWVDTYIHGLYSPSMVGKAVYHTSFKRDKHVQANVKIDPDLPVVIGFDCGLTPAAVFKQMGLDGRVRTLREAVAFDMGMKRFAHTKLRPIIKNFFPTNPLVFIGDPAGSRRADSDESTAFKMLKDEFKAEGAVVKPASTNDPALRIQATEQLLCHYPDGEPMEVIDASCKWYIDALRSKYRYPRQKQLGGFGDKPEKNEWSHVAEAGQYADLYLTSGKYHPSDFMRATHDDIFGFNSVPVYRPASSHGY